jgi:hypothetical protein
VLCANRGKGAMMLGEAGAGGLSGSKLKLGGANSALE